MLRGLFHGLLTGLVLGLAEVFFALPLLDDLFRFGLDRHYTLHGPIVASILGFDLLLGAFWGLAGATLLRLTVRSEGPALRWDALLVFWLALLPALVYPSYVLWQALGLPGPGRPGPLMAMLLILVWLAVAAGGGAVLFRLISRSLSRTTGFIGLALIVLPLTALVLGWSRITFRWDDPRGVGRVALMGLVLLAVAFGGTYLLTRLAQRPRPQRRLGLTLLAVTGSLALLVLWQSAFSVTSGIRGRLEDSGPNVLILMLDTFRDDHLGLVADGIPVTPILAGLAAESRNYVNCTATSSWTLPSHASLFTGLYPAAHGARFDAGDRLELRAGLSVKSARRLTGAPTLARILRDEGYATGAVCGNTTYLAPEFGLNDGFDFYDARMPQSYRMRPMVDVLLSRFRHRLPFDYMEMGYSVTPRRKPYRAARAVVDMAQWWLGQVRHKPFFLFLNFCDPHTPYLPPLKYDVFPGRPPHISPSRVLTAIDVGRTVSKETRDALLSLYRGECRYMDTEIGRLLQTLRTRGLLENTLVIVTSDHGELMGEHGWFEHGDYLYEDLIRVPLLVRHPGQPAPATIEHRVSLADILPTVLATLDLPQPEHIDGRPLDDPDRFVIAELYPSPERIRRVGDALDRTLIACYDGPWKLVRSVGHDGDVTDSLFHVEQDPAETTDLIAVEPERAATMARRLETAHEEMTLKAPDLSDTEPILHRDRIDVLRGMGYLGGS